MATKNKVQMERAMEEFEAIVKDETDHVGALLGLAQVQNDLGQGAKARNQLKRIRALPWTSEDADRLVLNPLFIFLLLLLLCLCPTSCLFLQNYFFYYYYYCCCWDGGGFLPGSRLPG